MNLQSSVKFIKCKVITKNYAEITRIPTTLVTLAEQEENKKDNRLLGKNDCNAKITACRSNIHLQCCFVRLK